MSVNIVDRVVHRLSTAIVVAIIAIIAILAGGMPSVRAESVPRGIAAKSVSQGTTVWLREARGTRALKIVRTGSSVRMLEVRNRYFFCTRGLMNGSKLRGQTQRGTLVRPVTIQLRQSGVRLTKQGKSWRSSSERVADRALLRQNPNAATMSDLWKGCQVLWS